MNRQYESTGTDYGDIPKNEAEMRKYLVMESKIELPHRKADSFEDLYKEAKQVSSQLPNKDKPNSSTTKKNNTNKNKNKNLKNLKNLKNNYNPKTEATPPPPPPTTAASLVSPVYQVSASASASSSAVSQISITSLAIYGDGGTGFVKEENTSNCKHLFKIVTKDLKLKTDGDGDGDGDVRSILSRQINEKHLIEQTKDSKGRVVIKQLPFAMKTHFKFDLFVEICNNNDNDNDNDNDNLNNKSFVEHLIVYCFKHITINKFCTFFSSQFNGGMFSQFELQLFIADCDGDLDDSFPKPELTKQMSSLGVTFFFLRILDANKSQREQLRKSTITYKQQIQMQSNHDNDNDDDESTHDETNETHESDTFSNNELVKPPQLYSDAETTDAGAGYNFANTKTEPANSCCVIV